MPLRTRVPGGWEGYHAFREDRRAPTMELHRRRLAREHTSGRRWDAALVEGLCCGHCGHLGFSWHISSFLILLKGFSLFFFFWSGFRQHFSFFKKVTLLSTRKLGTKTPLAVALKRLGFLYRRSLWPLETSAFPAAQLRGAGSSQQGRGKGTLCF